MLSFIVENLELDGGFAIKLVIDHDADMEIKNKGVPESVSHSSTSYWTPEEARRQFSDDLSIMQFMNSSSGVCAGYLQANVIILPSCLADDFTEFCRLNSAPCPLLYRSKVGEVGAPPLTPTNSDIRYEMLLD